LEDVNAVGERIDDFKSELLAMEKSVFEMMRQDINDQREEQLREQKDIMDEILNQLDTAKEEILISQVQIENTYKEIMQTGYSRQDETHQDMEMTLDDVESHKGQVDAAGDDSEIPYIGDEVPRESENLLGESENLLGESENLLEQEDTTDENNVGAIDELPGLYMEDLPDLEGSDDTAEEPNESLVLEETAVETKQETSDEEQEEEFTEGLGDLEEVEVIDQPLTDEKDTDEEEYTQDDQSMLEGLAMLNEIQNLDNDEEKQNDMEKEPDFSNPNKMMTADEIAALLENM
jgi:hypothetical protein